METPDHPNAAIARILWDAGATGDPEPFRRLYAPDAVLRSAGHNPVAGEFKGLSQILGLFARTGELVEELRAELLEVYASDAGAVMCYRIVAERGPKQLDMEYMFTLRIEDGRVVEASIVPADEPRNDEFWTLD
jgi:ketosteroid isomerase-like protein